MKRHWCGICRNFQVGVVRKVGYYKWERVCCATCGHELGSPDTPASASTQASTEGSE